MGIELNADEVFKMAEQIEKEGRDFYRQAASALAGANPTAARVLLELAEMEAEHVLTFSAMKTKLSQVKSDQAAFDAEGLSTIWPGVVEMFTAGVREDLTKLFSGQNASEQVLRKSIEFEKETLIFYVGVKEMLSNPDDKRKIDEIIKEELGHIIRLSGLLASWLS